MSSVAYATEAALVVIVAVSLDIVDAPLRDIGAPRLTARRSSADVAAVARLPPWEDGS